MAAPQERSILHELASFAEALAKEAAKLADDVEVILLRRDTISFGIQNRTLSPEMKLGRLQVGLRALKGGRLAMASTTSFVIDENLSALKAALPAARPSKIERFSSLRAGRVEDGLDEGLARFAREPAALQALAVDVRDRAFEAMKAHPHVQTVEGKVSIGTRFIAMATKDGAGAFMDDSLSAYAEVNSLRSEYELRRAWTGEDAIRDVAARAVRSLPEKRVAPSDLGLGPAAEVEAILDPMLVEALLRYPAQDKFLASSLESGQTSLEPGQRLAADGITLVDTGSLPELRRPFDDELVAKSDVKLIDGGRFGEFVTSRASALVTGLRETGNGLRAPILAEDVSEAPVRDRLTGLAMEPGERSVDALISSISLGILPRMVLGIHGADRARTAFSCTVADGVAIRDGKVVGQLAPGQWNVAGRVLPGDGEPGLLETAEASSERVYTGSAVVPFVRARLVI